MAGDGDDQMALAKSMSEKIEDADMQRSWSKVKSVTEKKPKKRSIPTLADMAADAKPDALDGREAEAQLLARMILERQKKPIPAEAMPDVISLAKRFAQAEEGMWGAARDMAERRDPREVTIEGMTKLMPAMLADSEELVAATPEWSVTSEAAVAAIFPPATADTPIGFPLVGTFTVTDSSGSVLAECENKIVNNGINDAITVTFPKPVRSNAGDTIKAEYKVERPNLKVHQPEPEKKRHAVFDDIVFDDALIAKMIANIAANGLTFADLGG